METAPSRDEFIELARGCTVIPVTRKVMADRETPVSIYEKLVGDQPGFLLESVEGGERWGRWSFVGWDPTATLSAFDGVSDLGGGDVTLPDGDPLTVLESLINRESVADLPDLPPLHSGAVGFVGFDAVRHIEDLPDAPTDDRGLPELVFHFVGMLAAVDRLSDTVTLICNVTSGDDPGSEYDIAVKRLAVTEERLGAATAYTPVQAELTSDEPVWSSTFGRSEFMEVVEELRREISSGNVFQVVLSQRLETPYDGDPFLIYRAIRRINPSPFLFYFRSAGLIVVGASPELMIRVRDGLATSRPIAGTRPRGADPAEDAALEEELLADPKERAEHVMLVDLARNDLGRVSEFGSVRVDDLMTVERYSHVMHLVSGISGVLRAEVGPIDVLRATFPHGTVSGAPKVAAIKMIDRVEPTRRGPYAGALGYVDYSGNIDTAICLRTIVLDGEMAWVQAGAGIVADSDPGNEFDETMDKAAAALAAIATAREMGRTKP
ncbi:MAG: anthranilate synthase component I [Acidimicrobiia bacterium]|nr:anthranilate synthase component I [Acidimicrobiia bacterium]